MADKRLPRTLPKAAVALLVVTVVVVAWAGGLGQAFTFENLRRGREALLAYADRHALGAVLAYLGAYVAVTTFSLPGAVPLTVGSGLVFGVGLGTLYTDIGATAGASGAFLLSRFVAGEWLQERFGPRLEKLNREIERNGVSYLLVVRLIALFPFYAVNVAAGLTAIRLRTFVWTTALGILPGTIVFAYAGSRLETVEAVADILSPQVFSAFLLLAALAALPMLAARRRGPAGRGEGREP